MKQENNNKGLITLVIILIVLVLCLGGYIIYDKVVGENRTFNDFNANTNNLSQFENTATSINKLNNVKGKYTVTFSNLKNNETGCDVEITLNLYENGIFSYEGRNCIATGTLGNYIVSGNSIILTNWFNSGNGANISITKGTKTLTINADGSITDNNIKTKALIDNDITTATLIKTGDLNEYDISNRLSVGLFTENNHTIFEPAM